jgi:hypothetical protein
MNNMNANKKIIFGILVLAFSVMSVVPVCGQSGSQDFDVSLGIANSGTNGSVSDSGATPPPTAEVGLVAYYPFDGDFVDLSGTVNNSTNHGATFVPGYKGQALSFDGVHDFVSAPVNINPDVMPQMTMIAWARSNSTSNGWVISHDNGGYDRTLTIDTRGGGPGWSAFSGSKGVLGYSPVTIGEWTFLAAVYDQDAETVKLYVNGALINEGEGKLGPGWEQIQIGANPSYSGYFSGAIDEVRIYNRTLSADELKALYEGEELSAPTSGQTSEEKVILLEEDFDDGNAQEFGNEVGDWEVRFLDDQNDGKYTATTGDKRFSMAGNLTWQDYVIEANFSNAQDGGLLVRVQDKDNGIILVVRPEHNETYWHVIENGSWGTALAKVTLGHEVGEELHVKVVVSGSEFEGYINGELKTTLNYSEFTSGKIGLYLFNQSDQYWDNVVVYRGGATPTTPQPTVEAGLVAYYPFDGDLVDHSRNGNNGTSHGATFVSGYSGQALSFDGLDDYVFAPVNINAGVMPQMTMSAWARSNSDSDGTVISCDDGGYDRTMDIDSRGGGTGWSAFSGSKGVLGYSPVTIGEWTFVAAVYDQDAETVKLYVNGALINEEEGLLESGLDYIHIGANPSHRQYFSGTIDEVRIYNRTLSAEEINREFNAYINGEQKTTLNTGELPKGKIGLYLSYQPDQYWDDVVVYGG